MVLYLENTPGYYCLSKFLLIIRTCFYQYFMLNTENQQPIWVANRRIPMPRNVGAHWII
jgi:hypothetical protein